MTVGSVAANLRTLLVKVSPAPTTLSERRAVLGVLKKYALVDLFKKLHDPSHFISTVREEQMALSLVAKSPLQFDYAARPARHSTTTTTPKTFLVKIIDKVDYSHKGRIREGLTYGRWPGPESAQQHQQHGDLDRDAEDPAALFREDSLPRAALRAVCPRDMAWAGLSDWESAGQLEGEGVAATLSAKGEYVSARQRKRGRTESWFESLVDMYAARREGEGEGEGEGGKGGEEGGAQLAGRPGVGDAAGGSSASDFDQGKGPYYTRRLLVGTPLS